MHDKIFTLLTDEKEITWQAVIKDLVKSEQMDPWDIDISSLGQKYRKRIDELQEHNFFVSGKIILACALLLRMKSHVFLTEHIPSFDNQLFPPEEEMFDGFSEDVDEGKFYQQHNIPPLLVKTPQPRKKKISLNDLMKALEKALEVDTRRELRRKDEEVIRKAVIPIIHVDITKLINDLYDKICIMFRTKEQITFTKLVDSDKREDKVQTFIPLLHLQKHDKIDLQQEVSFGEIYINEGIKSE